DDGVVVGAVPGRRIVAGLGEPGAERGNQQQVEDPVKNGLLPGDVFADLLGEQRYQRALPVLRPQHEPRWERGEQAAADLAGDRVGAGEHDQRAVGARTPGADADVAEFGEVFAVGGPAFLAGVDDGLRRGSRVVGDQIRVGPPDDREVAGPET